MKKVTHQILSIACFSAVGWVTVELTFFSPSSIVAQNLAQTAENAEANQLLRQGIDQFKVRKFTEAIETWQRALKLFRAVGNRNGEGAALNSLGNAFVSIDQNQKAIDVFLQSLAIAKQTNDRGGEAGSLNNIGNAYDNLGEYQKAIEVYEQSLAIKREIGDRYGEKNSLNNLGKVLRSIGKYQKAIEYLQQSLALSKEIGDRGGEGNSSINLGNTYYSIGQYQKGIELFNQSLAIFKQVSDRQGEGSSLSALGNSYFSLGEYPKAIEFYEQSLVIRRQISDRRGEGSSLSNLGNVYFKQKQFKKAVEFYEQSLVIKKEVGDRNGEANTLGNLGNSYDALAQYQKGVEFHQQSLAIFKQSGDRGGEARTLRNLGLTLNNLKYSALAIFTLKQSVNIRESIRQDIRNLSRQEQQAYTETIAKDYSYLADLLLQQGRITEALQVLDLLKIQELQDFFQDIKGNAISSQGVPLFAPEQKLQDSFNQITAETSDLNSKLQQQLSQLPSSELNSIPTALRSLPPGVVLLYPLVLDDRLELIIFAANKSPTRHTIAVNRKELEEAISEFSSNLQTPKRLNALNPYDISDVELKITSQKLYKWLIQPIESDLKTAKTILYAPDGKLRYVPLTALYDGKQWLVEKYEINYLISYSLANLNPASPTSPNILAGAFGKTPKFSLQGLPASEKEVQNLATALPNTKILIEQQFSRLAIEQQLASHNIIHLSTHAEFGNTPKQSFIAFGNGDRITIEEIKNWQLPHVELVVLSACKTGIGEKLGTGIEILGFGYQFQRTGVKNSIASLWEVNDEGTQIFMDNFYSRLLVDRRSPSQALQQAQIALATGKVSHPKLKLSHPFYWSTFFPITSRFSAN